MSMKYYNFKKVLKKELSNKRFRQAYEELGEEFQLAEEVIRLRKKKSLTQKELAVKTGTSQPAIARLESGKYQNVSLSFLKRLGRALNTVPEIHFRPLGAPRAG